MSKDFEEVIGKQITGRFKIQKVMFQKEDNDFKILSLKEEYLTDGKYVDGDVNSNYDTITALGNIHSVQDGDVMNFVLERTLNPNPKYGKYQFKIISVFLDVNLENEDEQRLFLSKILTANQYENLYKAFENPYKILMENDREALLKIKGFGSVTVEKIMDSVLSTKDNSKAYVQLAKYGLSKESAQKLVKKYQANPLHLIEKLSKNPYFLIEEVDGYGFKRADAIALKMGIPEESEFRIKAFIISYLKQEEANGHSWCNPSEMFGALYDILELERGNQELSKKIGNIMKGLFTKGEIWYDEHRTQVCLNRTRQMEKRIANHIARLDKCPADKFKCENWMEIVREIEKEQGWEYTFEQLNAIKTMMNKNVVFVLGLGGCGKTTIINAYLEIMSRNKLNFAQCALSGRASAKMAEVTGRSSSTIHRLLKLNSRGTKEQDDSENEDDEKKVDVLDGIDGIIIDEISMVDEVIFEKVLKEMKDGMKLIAVGDQGQLSSIGLGSIPRDIQESGVVGYAELTQIHRQAQKSAVITESHKIRNGVQLVKRGQEIHEIRGELQDLEIDVFKKDESNKELTQEKVLEQFEKHMFLVPSIMDLQVVVPMKNRGLISTYELNSKLQEIYNPKREFSGFFGKKPERDSATLRVSGGKTQEARVGDKIIVTKNNYNAITLQHKNAIDEVFKVTGEELEVEKTPIFNGDMGIIIDIKSDGIVVELTRVGDIYISDEELNTIELAYAISTHKCITEDTWIPTSEGLVQLKDLNNGAEVGEFKEFTEDIKVFNGEYLEKPTEFYNAGLSECKKITTQRGYRIEASLDHRCFIVGEDGYPKEIFAKDLKNGDTLMIRKGANIYGNKKDLPKEWGRRVLHQNSNIYVRPMEMTPDFAKLLGLIVADGCVTKGTSVNFSKKHEEVTIEFLRLMKKLFGYEGKYTYRKSGDYMVYVSSRDINNFFKNIDGLQPNNKFIPECIMKADKESQVAFLSGLFEDGAVSLKKGKFDYVEISLLGEKPIKQIQQLLLNMGVISTMRNYEKKAKHNNQYQLYIYRKEVKKLIDLGFRYITHQKQERLEKALVEPSNGKTISYSKYRNINSVMRELKESHNLIFSGNDKIMCCLRNALTMKHCSDTTLERFLSVSKEQNENIIQDERYIYLQKLSEEYYFDDIVEIEDTQKETYCLTMSESGRFVQNGILLGNCQGSSYNTVIVAIDNSAYVMLNKELVYTAITRTSKYCVLIAENSALHKAIETSEGKNKRTFLADFLKEAIDS